MDKHISTLPSRQGIGTLLPPRPVTRVPVVALAASLASFFTVTYVLCVLFDLWFPGQAMYRVWAPLLPGFEWISWPSFFLGLIESMAYGGYIGFVCGPLFNCISAKLS